jgi:endonuclease/exonuclease/phosphatase family metal-dependent hydrolase
MVAASTADFLFFRGNTNGTVSFIEASAGHHHLRGSAKKLVVETMLPDLTILTIHLPLSKKGRRVHLQELAKTVNTHQGNIIIGGDFNLFYGTTELTDFLATTGLKAAGEPQPTFPAAKPRFHLDLFLYRFVDTTITPRVRTIDSKLSDHLPVLLEW